MANRTTLEVVTCAICGAPPGAGEVAYRRPQEAGVPLGRLEVSLVLCTCGFLYQSPRPDREAFARHYQGQHASGATWHEVGEASRHGVLTRRRGAFLAAALLGGREPRAPFPSARPSAPPNSSGDPDPGGPPTPFAVLDVGCGRGDLLAGLDPTAWGGSEASLRRVGLEPSAAAARAAREKGLEVIEESLETTGLLPGSFDAVTCISMLEHALDPRAAAAGLARLARPGGVVMVEVPDSLRPRAQVAEFFSFEHVSHFTRSTLVSLFAAEGCVPLAVERDEEHSGLRVAFRRLGQGEVAPPASSGPAAGEERDALREALGRYRVDRAAVEREVRAVLAPRVAAWRRDGSRVAIFGAGIHTRFLLDLVELAPCVTCILDSDPRKQGEEFLGWPVHAPWSARELGVDAVVISSRAYQEEMAAAMAPAAGEGIEIVRCYRVPPRGSTGTGG